MIGLDLLLCAASLVLPRELLTESWGKARDGGEIRQTPEERVFAALRPRAGIHCLDAPVAKDDPYRDIRW